MTKPLVIAHRGASHREVENSLAAFRRAAALGADGVELDVHATVDGALIVHHDEALDPTLHITRLPADRVRAFRLSNGEPVPTLAEALEAVGPALQVFVEVKSLPERFDRHLVDALRHGPNPAGYAVHSFDHRIVHRLGDRLPTLARGVLSCAYPVRPLAPLEDAGAGTLWQQHELIDEDLVVALHDAGRRIVAWTVDQPEAMERLLALQVDAICTNAPAVGRRVVDAAAR